MSFNLAPSARIFSSNGRQLTEVELSSLSDGITTISGVVIGAGDLIEVTCDLVARYSLDKIVYWSQPATTETVVISARQNINDDWDALSYTVLSGTITSDLSNLADKYQLVRVTHSVTAGTAEAFELEIFTEDEVGFGIDGSLTVQTINAGTSQNSADVVRIYNTDDITHDFFCLLDADDVDSFDLTLSSNISGPYFDIYGTGISLPTTFSFSAGDFTNTEVVSDTVRLISSTTSGIYFSPVMDVSTLDGRRLYWKSTLSGTNEIDEFGSVDDVPVISIRYSDIVPTDGGWASGQLSIDGQWSTISGALLFNPYSSNQILEPHYRDYIQMRVELHSPSTGQTPILEKIGVEEGFKLTISPSTFGEVFLLAKSEDHTPNREAGLISWFFESRST